MSPASLDAKLQNTEKREVEGPRRGGRKDGPLVSTAYKRSGQEISWKIDVTTNQLLKYYLIR